MGPEVFFFESVAVYGLTNSPNSKSWTDQTWTDLTYDRGRTYNRGQTGLEKPHSTRL